MAARNNKASAPGKKPTPHDDAKDGTSKSESNANGERTHSPERESLIALADRIRANFPKELHDKPIWLCWRSVPNPDPTDKPKKVPCYATSGRNRTGTQGTPEDRAQLVTMEVALDAMVQREYAGVGMATLPDNGLIVVDVDNAKDASGEWFPFAKDFINGTDSYIERSPRGGGVHGIFAGVLDKDQKSGKLTDGISIELFCNSGYVTVTGDRLNGTEILNLPEASKQRLIQLVAESKQGKTTRTNQTATVGRNVDLTSWGGYFRRRGMVESEILAAIRAINANRNDPPLTEEELKTIAQSVAKYEPSEVGKEGWAKPINVFKRFAARPLSADDVPPLIGRLATLNARAGGFDPTMGLVMGVGAAAAMLDDGIRLKLPKASKWYESPRLWILVAGESSNAKSPSSEMMYAPVKNLERSLRELWLRAKDQAERDRAQGGPTDEIPPEPRLWTKDPTTEALREVLEENPRGIFVIPDEIEQWLGAHDAYRKGGTASKDRGEWLALYQGGPHRIDRVGLHVFVPNWSASILSTTTYVSLQRFSKDLPNDGLLQRFMLFSAPVRPRYDPTVKESEVDAAYARYDARLRQLYEFSPRTVVLSPEAARLFLAEEERILTLAEALQSTSAALASHVGKHGAMLARVVLVFHAMLIEGHPADEPIPLQTMEMAARFIKRAFEHAFMVYGIIFAGATPQELMLSMARSILAEGLKEKGFTSFNSADLTRHCKAYEDAATVDRERGLRALWERDWIRPENERHLVGAMMWGARWEVNPAVHELFIEDAERAAAKRKTLRDNFEKSSREEAAIPAPEPEQTEQPQTHQPALDADTSRVEIEQAWRDGNIVEPVVAARRAPIRPTPKPSGKVVAFLRDLLTSHARLGGEVLKAAADKKISRKALDAAVEVLQVVIEPIPDGGFWWYLPEGPKPEPAEF